MITRALRHGYSIDFINILLFEFYILSKLLNANFEFDKCQCISIIRIGAKESRVIETE